MQDIKRMCKDPTDEDREWFPNLVGKDWIEEVQKAAFETRDETLILEYLSPKVMRDMGMFAMRNESDEPFYEILGASDKQGYETVRTELAAQYNIHNIMPSIEIIDVDVRGDRTLTLRHVANNDTELDYNSTVETMHHIQHIWDFDVKLVSTDTDGEEIASMVINRPETPPTRKKGRK